MRAAYRYCHNNQLQTARLLGVSRNVVRARLIQFGEIAGSLRAGGERKGSEPPPPESERYATPPSPLSARPSAAHRLSEVRRAVAGQAARRARRHARQARVADRVAEIRCRAADRRRACASAGAGARRRRGVPAVFAQADDVPIVYLAAEEAAPEREAILVHGARASRASPICGASASPCSAARTSTTW